MHNLGAVVRFAIFSSGQKIIDNIFLSQASPDQSCAEYLGQSSDHSTKSKPVLVR